MTEETFNDGVRTFSERVSPDKLADIVRMARRNHYDHGGRCVHVATIPYEQLGATWCRDRALLHGYVSIVEPHLTSVLGWTKHHPEIIAGVHAHLVAYHPCHELFFMFVCFPPDNAEMWVTFATLRVAQP